MIVYKTTFNDKSWKNFIESFATFSDHLSTSVFFVFLEDTGSNPDHDTESLHSVFRGSLGIDVDVGTWESSIADQMDVRVGREQWETSFCDIVSGNYKIDY